MRRKSRRTKYSLATSIIILVIVAALGFWNTIQTPNFDLTNIPEFSDSPYVEVNGNVPSGTLDSPSANTLGIKISTTADALELNTLRLNMTATCPSAQHQGVPLNENQGLHIKSLAISLPDGITMDLNK